MELSTCEKNDLNDVQNNSVQSNPVHEIFRDCTMTKILNNPDYEIQIRYTQIDRDQNNQPKFTTHSWNEHANYFYPASSVKMPVAFAALQKFGEVKKTFPCLSIYDPFIVGVGQKPQAGDTLHPYTKQKQSLAEHIRLVFAVSDNNAYNRLFEFTGQDYINTIHRDKNIFSNSHIIHRVGIGGFSYTDNQFTNPLSIHGQNCTYEQAANRSITPFTIKPKSFKGIGYANAQNKIVNEPFDFTQKNYLSLIDLEASLMRVVFPNAFPKEHQYNLSKEDYDFLYKTMDELPRDIPYLARDTNYYDTYVKFFYGDKGKKTTIPKNIHIFNKVGFAYGTLTDCSYIFDSNTGTEFFLTATMLVNKNKIFNDGKYEYDEVGIPFLAKLGMKVLEYEQKRKKTYKPDFSIFNVD